MSTPFSEAITQYERFVGSFTGQYANLEAVLRMTLKQHSGLDDELYDILIGFPRTGEIVTKLRKLFPRIVKDPSVRADAVRAFTHLDNVTKLRDRIVHYGGHPVEGDKLLIRTKPTERVEETGEAYILHTRQELWDAHRDLQKIISFVGFHIAGWRSRDPEHDTAFSRDAALDEAWLYKPPRLAQNPK